MKLIDYLKAERGRLGRVAAILGMSPAYLSQIANGRKPCPLKRAPAIEEACAFEVRRWDLCEDDWHKTWPELIGTEGAATHQRAPKGGHGRRASEMRNIRVDAASRSAQPAPPAAAGGDGSARAAPLLRAEILRMAAQAAEAACRSKPELGPREAAMAVIEAYCAARDRLDLEDAAIARQV